MKTRGFELMPFAQVQLHDALRIMCPRALKGFDGDGTALMRAEWSPLNPTRFCCYFVSEMAYWFAASRMPTTAMAMRVPGDFSLHRYVQTSHGRIDLTCDQFDFDLDYTVARPRMFLQCGGVGPSARARQLASLLNI